MITFHELTERQVTNLMRRVDKTAECWLWTGTIKSRYGLYCAWDASRKVKINLPAHRAVWMALRGAIPEGMELDHLCKNPICVNPNHLEPVTRDENQRRSANPSSVNGKKAICVRGHLLDGTNLYLQPNGYRQCRECRRLRWERYEARRKAGEAPPRSPDRRTGRSHTRRNP